MKAKRSHARGSTAMPAVSAVTTTVGAGREGRRRSLREASPSAQRRRSVTHLHHWVNAVNVESDQRKVRGHRRASALCWALAGALILSPGMAAAADRRAEHCGLSVPPSPTEQDLERSGLGSGAIMPLVVAFWGGGNHAGERHDRDSARSFQLLHTSPYLGNELSISLCVDSRASTTSSPARGRESARDSRGALAGSDEVEGSVP